MQDGRRRRLGYRIHTLPGGRRLAGLWSGWARFRGEIEALKEIEEIVCVLKRRSRMKMSGQCQNPKGDHELLDLL
jgi:hypothetical protein